MKAKHLFLAIAALLAVGGLWFAWTARRADTILSHKSSTSEGFKTIRENADANSEKPGERPGRGKPNVASTGSSNPGQMLRPPDPNRRFTDFTPEQRVQFARQGHGPGG